MTTFGILLPSDKNPEHSYVLCSFAQGIQEHGDQFKISADPNKLLDCDVAVIFGMYKKLVPLSIARGWLFEKFRSSGKNVVVIDSGYIQRHKYYMVGLNGLNGRAEFPRATSGIRAVQNGSYDLLRPWRKNGDHVLLIGQVPWDASVEGTNHIQWIEDTINCFRKIGNQRELRFRPHPKVGLEAYVRYLPMQGIVNISTSSSLEDDLKNCWAVITFNSNVGVDAVLAGIPVFTADPGSMVRDVSNRTFPMNIEPAHSCPTGPKIFERDKWLKWISYAQWTTEEMRSGECLNNLSTIL